MQVFQERKYFNSSTSLHFTINNLETTKLYKKQIYWTLKYSNLKPDFPKQNFKKM